LEEKTDFIELEKITNGKFTDRAQNQYPTARSQQKSVDISYVQSSVENTHREEESRRMVEFRNIKILQQLKRSIHNSIRRALIWNN